MELIKHGRIFDFMGKRAYFLGLSIILMAISCVSYVYPGPKWGTDFRGGTASLGQICAAQLPAPGAASPCRDCGVWPGELTPVPAGERQSEKPIFSEPGVIM